VKKIPENITLPIDDSGFTAAELAESFTSEYETINTITET